MLNLKCDNADFFLIGVLKNIPFLTVLKKVPCPFSYKNNISTSSKIKITKLINKNNTNISFVTLSCIYVK